MEAALKSQGKAGNASVECFTAPRANFAQIKGNGTIDIEFKICFKALNVDAHGLDEMDNKILTTIIDKFKGGPVGLSTLATIRK
jgi:Holliday junction DNA helicase RuvB